jgi:uncharacterized protein YutE (UPF0331/DUF86 family)
MSMFVSRLVLGQLAKFHACSYAWLQDLDEPACETFPEFYEVQDVPAVKRAYATLLETSNSIVHHLIKVNIVRSVGSKYENATNVSLLRHLHMLKFIF